MQDFQDKVAVVTGAASGIGRALAEQCLQLGMFVVLADVEEVALSRTGQELDATGSRVLAVQTDVSKAEDVAALARQALERFGAVHLLFNNAGVGAGSFIWECSLADWDWTLGVNLYGVIHGIRTFVPLMLAQNNACHIVNTASMAGLISGPGLGIYKVTKHGVVTISETLYHELTALGANIKVSVLCPGWVNTRITEAERNRPVELQNVPQAGKLNPLEIAMLRMVQQATSSGMPAEQVAQIVFQAIRDEKFYILTHPEMKGAIHARMKDILEERNPTNGGLA